MVTFILVPKSCSINHSFPFKSRSVHLFWMGVVMDRFRVNQRKDVFEILGLSLNGEKIL